MNEKTKHDINQKTEKHTDDLAAKSAALAAHEQEIEDHEQKIKELNEKGIPYLHRSVYWMDDLGRPQRFYNPRTKQSEQRVMLGAFTQIEILKRKKDVAIVSRYLQPTRRFIIPADAITNPREIKEGNAVQVKPEIIMPPNHGRVE